jgi:cell division protein FtsQ
MQMAIKVNIRKVLFVTLWCIVGAGVLVLLVAAINLRNSKTCKGYRIDIEGPAGESFIDRKEVLSLLGASKVEKWQGRPILSFDLRHMESALEKNAWIQDAQLFFDNNGVLRVNVTGREPVVRLFMTDGNSCYMDSSGVQLPLPDKFPVKLPVFTGYPAPGIRLHGADSALTGQIRKMGIYIGKDPFWMAQIAQINIRPDRSFDLVPVIGNHLVEFGDGNDYEQKFHRLFVFYKEVSSRTGFDKYSRIDVQYAGQVIGTKKGSEISHLDSLQGMRNIQQLIRTARQWQNDTVKHWQNSRPLERNTETEQTLTNYDLIPESGDTAWSSGSNAPGPALERAGSEPAGVKPPVAENNAKPPAATTKPRVVPMKPRAVMQPRAVMKRQKP